MRKNVLIVAGETSGDIHASGLVEEMKKISPEISFWGLGGEKMSAAGVKIVYGLDKLSFLGFFEVLKHLRSLRKIFNTLIFEIEKNSPHLAILVDYPGFNLKLAKRLRAKKVPVVYYISPQIWAWGEKRIQKIRKYVNKILVFFEFEEELYKKNGIPVELIGHPLLNKVRPVLSKTDFFQKFEIPQNKELIGFFPGSRIQEVQKILPVMLEAFGLISQKYKNLYPAIGLAPAVPDFIVKGILKSGHIIPLLVRDLNYDLMSYSKILLTSSGTASFECALSRTPFVVIYKTNFFTYLLAKKLVKIPHIAMINVLAKREVVPELIQNDANPKKIAQKVCQILDNPDLYQKIKLDLERETRNLKNDNPYQKAALSVCRMLD